VTVVNDLPEIRKEAFQIKKAHADKVAQDYLVKLSKPAIDLENLSQSPIEHFNSLNVLKNILLQYGYLKQSGRGTYYRSPLQTSSSYATTIRGHRWISLSASDDAAGLGRLCLSGCSGDAFDLYVYFAHNGDFNAALSTYSNEAGLKRQSYLGTFSAAWSLANGK